MKGFTIKKPTIILLAIGIFVAANLFLSPFSFRLDFSKGKAYTLSAATEKIISNLKEAVEIKFFVSSDLPTRLLPIKNDVVDFLNEYKKEGKKITVKIADPKKNEKDLQEIQEAGIPQLQFSQLENNKYALTNAYFGIIIKVKDKKEIIAQATDIGSLEYNLTAAIYKLTGKKEGKIAVIGKNEIFDSNEDDLYTLKKVLRQQFSLDFIQEKINSDYDALLVFDNNEKKYTKEEIEEIKKYLDKKGKAVFFVDGVWIDKALISKKADHNLFDFLKSWGVEVNRDLVLSTSAELVNFGNANIQFFTAYPFWLKTGVFNGQTGFFSNINVLIFPWVSSLKINKKNGIDVVELVKTTKRSWNQKDNYILNPQQIPPPQAKDLKQFIIAAQAKKKDSGEIILISSSRFVQQRYLSQNSDNLEFVLNILNELASGGALSGIRQRTVAFYPLPDLPENQKDIFKYLNIFLLPSLLGLFGTVRLLRRR